MKKILRKASGWLVTIYANRTFKKAVKTAEEAHAKLGERIYVVSSFSDISELVVLNRDTFRKMKKMYNLRHTDLSSLMEGAWYYTADRAGKNGLPAKEKEVRRLAFVRHMLMRAKLL